MKVNLIIFLIIITANIKAQIPSVLQVSGSGWRYVGWTLDGTFPYMEDVYTLIFNGDTLIDNKIYHKNYFSLVQHVGFNPGTTLISSAYNGCLRSEGEKVYYIAKDSLEEFLLFDYSLSIGDTIPKGQFNDTINRIITDTVTMEMEDGSYRRKYVINHWNPRFFLYGIGYETGLLQPSSFIIHPYDGGTDFVTYCESGIKIYYDHNVGGFYNASNCDFPVSSQIKESKYIYSIYPNPCINGTISIKGLNDKDQIERITLINELGLTIKDFQIEASTIKELNIKGIDAGSYILRIIEKDRKAIHLNLILQ